MEDSSRNNCLGRKVSNMRTTTNTNPPASRRSSGNMALNGNPRANIGFGSIILNESITANACQSQTFNNGCQSFTIAVFKLPGKVLCEF